MLHFTGPDYAELVACYEDSFESIWDTGRDDDLLASLRSTISTAASIPIVFDPMALEWQEYHDLKSLIIDNCSSVNSTDFRNHPDRHMSCQR